MARGTPQGCPEGQGTSSCGKVEDRLGEGEVPQVAATSSGTGVNEKPQGPVVTAQGVRVTTRARSYRIVADLQSRIKRGDNVDAIFPEWAGRLLLAEALRAVGLPWVPWAVWRRRGDVWMSFEDRLAAIDMEARVVTEARRRLPAGVSSAALGREWREAAWRCTVAGMAIVDVDAPNQLGHEHGEEPGGAGELVRPPVTISRRSTPAMTSSTAVAPTILFRRRGEVPRAS